MQNSKPRWKRRGFFLLSDPVKLGLKTNNPAVEKAKADSVMAAMEKAKADSTMAAEATAKETKKRSKATVEDTEPATKKKGKGK